MLTSNIDNELKEILSKALPKILVIGSGGAGNNTINRLYLNYLNGIKTVAINTDAQDLLKVKADKKILIGKTLTNGLGAGSYPEVGEKAAYEDIDEIKEILNDKSVVFLTSGLGGGTGTGSLPVIAEISKRTGALTIAIVTMPFTMEGKKRYDNAVYGLLKLEKRVDAIIIISNDKLLELYPKLPMKTTFQLCDKLLTDSINNIIEMISKPGIVNLDLADLKSVLRDIGYSIVAFGEGEGSQKSKDCIELALGNPLLDVEINGAKGALINITGGTDLRLEEAHNVVKHVMDAIGGNAKMKWGVQIDNALKNKIKVMAIITGIPRQRFEKYFYFESYKHDYNIDIIPKEVLT